MSTNERGVSADPKHYGDNFIPVIPGEYLEHSPENPFCWSGGCPCREDQDAIHALNAAYQDGLITSEEVNSIYHGRTV